MRSVPADVERKYDRVRRGILFLEYPGASKGASLGASASVFPPRPPPGFNVEGDFQKNRLATAWFEQHCRGGVRGEIYTYTSLKHDVLLQLFHP